MTKASRSTPITVIWRSADCREAARLSGLLDPETVEKVIGHAELLATFKSSKAGTIAAGLVVTDGVMRLDRRSRAAWTRDGIIPH